MKRISQIVVLAIILVGVATSAFAQGGADVSTGLPLDYGKWLSSRGSCATCSLRLLRADSSDNTEVNAASGKVVRLSAAQTAMADVDATSGVLLKSNTQQIVFQAQSIITPKTDLTPTSGSTLSNRFNAIATAAPTANFVFIQETPNVGKSFSIYNPSANPLQIIPRDGVINQSAALTPFACAATKDCRCDIRGTGTAICVAQ